MYLEEYQFDLWTLLIMSNDIWWRYVSIDGQGHFLTLAQSQLHVKPSETTGPIKGKFYMYLALVTPAHHSLIKWWLWVDLDLFYGKVKFGN